MRGRQIDIATKEKAIAMLMASNNTAEVARQLNIKESTLRTWKSNMEKGKDKDCKVFAELRQEKKKKFIEDSWKNIELASIILNRRLARACADEVLLDAMLKEALEQTAGSERRKEVVRNIASMKLEDINKVSTTLGTLYDKQALANGEATSREEQVIKKFEDFN